MANKSIFDTEWIHGLVLLYALGCTGVVIVALGRVLPSWALLIVGSIAVVASTGLLVLGLWVLDRFRLGNRSRLSDDVTTAIPTVLKVLAFAFAFAPTVLTGEVHVNWLTWVVGIFLACLSAWSASALKTYIVRSRALVQLRELHPKIAAYFATRSDHDGWPEIQPNTVMVYQEAFDRVLNDCRRRGGDLENGIFTETQREWLSKACYDGFYRSNAPIPLADSPERVVAALFLSYVHRRKADDGLPPEEEWAAAIATQPGAAQLRRELKERIRTFLQTRT